MRRIAMTEKNRFANRYEVMNVPCPEPTETWNPISHARLLGALDLGVKTMGIEVRSETYTLAREGRRLFGSWVLDIGNGAKWMIGFRQGLDKSMAIGIQDAHFRPDPGRADRPGGPQPGSSQDQDA
jgi:hypothetical protein